MRETKFKLGTLFILMALPLMARAADVTLSDSLLLSLDWHDPSINAKVVAVRNTDGPGVEFDIQFPGTTHPNASVHFISGKAGGAGMLAGLDLEGYDNFALSFTLLAVDGKNQPEIDGGIIIGALIYNDVTKYAYRPEVVNITSSGEKKAVTSATRLDKHSVEGLGFQARLPKNTKWKEGTTLTLLVAPAPGAVQIEPRVFVPVPPGSAKVIEDPKNIADSRKDEKNPIKEPTPVAEKPITSEGNSEGIGNRPMRAPQNTSMTYREWLIGMALSSGRSAAIAVRDADEVIRLLSATKP